MIAAIPIPIVHFIAVPLSPFIAGFIGGGVAEADDNDIIKFGGLMALLMLLPALAVLIAKYALGTDSLVGIRTDLLFWVTLALIPYTWFGATVGAMISSYTRKGEQSEN